MTAARRLGIGDVMAEDNRNYRARDAYGRPAAPAAQANDPLAELARLIGQTDPFSEFGRDNRAASQQPQGVPASVPPPAYGEEPYRAPNFAATPSAPQHYASDADHYRGYETPHIEPQQPGSYDAAAYYHDAAAAHHDDDAYADDVQPRRRISIIAIAGVFALAVVGTAGAFGYRALFGSSGSSPPPVIRADTTPTKVVPATNNSDTQSNKLITDRVGDRSQLEKLVSREEQPIDLKDKPPQAIFPNMPAAAAPQPPGAPAAGVAGEPKKIRTIAIRADGTSGTSDTAQPPAPPAPASPARAAAAPAAPSPAAKPPAEPAAAPRQVTARRPVPSANAPLSLNPNAEQPAPSPAPAARTPTPVRTASVSSSADHAAPGAYVQVSSQRSEADAQASFRSLQGKYPAQLGSRAAVIRRADLGEKGTYYRAMVGPFGSADQAAELCTSLKSAGGQCLVQRN